MPVPYQPPLPAAADGRAGYVDLLADGARLLAGLLLIDGLGRPVEFVHNHADVDTGADWSRAVPTTIVPALIHSLFDACRGEPDLLCISSRVGPSEYCRTVLAPAVPCLVLDLETGETTWLSPPSAHLRGRQVAQELERRGLTKEPFERLLAGLATLANHHTHG